MFDDKMDKIIIDVYFKIAKEMSMKTYNYNL